MFNEIKRTNCNLQNAKVGGVEKTTVFITVVQTSAGGAAHPRWPVLMYALVQIWTTPKLHILYTMATYIHMYTNNMYTLTLTLTLTLCIYTNNIEVEYRARCHIMQHRSAKEIEQLGLDESRDSMGHAQTICTLLHSVLR